MTKTESNTPQVAQSNLAEPAKILIIDDEAAIRAGLVDGLSYEGYTVLCSENGASGLETFEKEKPDLVILDLMMPGVDGLEVCRRIRSATTPTAIIMLTARGSEVDKVVGLELGADDYLTKPFGMRELFARVKAVLRRAAVVEPKAQPQTVETELTFDDVRIDFKTYRASKGGEEVTLSAKEFELIRFLASQPDVPVTRDSLLDKVWGYNSYPSTRTVDNFIARLRAKLEDNADSPRHILTVHGVGYKFVF